MAALAFRQIRVRTPLQPDVPSLVAQGASFRRHPLKVRLRRPHAHRNTAGTPDTYSPGISSRPEVYRAVPRSERPAARDNDVYAPTPPYGGVYGGVPGGVPDRSYRVPSSPSAPSQDAPDRSRAMPRSGSDGGGSPYGYRAPERSQPTEGSGSRTGPERSAPGPSGPPPSAAPSQPSGPSSGSGQGRPSGASGGGESRSRSGGSVGRAVPRGGRG